MRPTIHVAIFVVFLAAMYGTWAAPDNWLSSVQKSIESGVNDVQQSFDKTVNGVQRSFEGMCGKLACPEGSPFHYYDCCGLECCMKLTPLSYILIALAIVFFAILGIVCMCCTCCCHA